jgi:RNA polymerase sigma-70 factor (ECF subfamily)
LTTLDYKEDLVHGLITNDRQAQYKFYEMYSKAMYNICLRMVRNEMDAEDILQNSFVDAYRSIKNFNFNSTPGAWLKRIVVNNCINHLKKRRLNLVDMNDSYDLAYEPDDEKVEYRVDSIREAIADLPEGYRLVLSLYLLEGYDHSEIASVLGISESTSKSQYSRARKKLKEIIIERNINIYEG